MGNRILLPVVLLAFACGSTPLNPNDFDIDGGWGGDFVLGAQIFPMGFTLSPKEDGSTELYDADGNFFTSFPKHQDKRSSGIHNLDRRNLH